MSNPNNHLQLIGRLTGDPELRRLESGKTVCNMRLAVDGMGGREEAGYIDVAVWGNPGEACARTLAKGWLVAASGALQVRVWKTDERSGIDVSIPFAAVRFLTAPKPRTDQSTGQAQPVEEPIAF